jgi:hypothetical protein
LSSAKPGQCLRKVGSTGSIPSPRPSSHSMQQRRRERREGQGACHRSIS